MKKAVVIWLVLGCCFISLDAFAEVGGIRGTVMDQDFEVPLPGVKVRISETGQETETGDAGSFVFENVQPGSYTLLFSKSGYTRMTQAGVVVSPALLAETDVSMAGEYEEMDELVVRDIQLGGASEIGLLNLRMESPALMDAIGADLMSQSGASDAAGALKLVAGASVQDGKYAVIRGLPDRYVSSQMNGICLPTADEDKRAVQLDQFPAAMIESVQVSKTFTPDQQGDASGGAVNVMLKGIPDGPVLTAGIGGEVNSQVWDNRNNFLTYRGGGVNFWGNGTGSRAIPSNIETQTPTVGSSRGTAPGNYSWDAGAGDKYTFDSGVKVGGFANFFYKHDASYHSGIQDKYQFIPAPEASDFLTAYPSLGGAPHLLPEFFGSSGDDPYSSHTENPFSTALYHAEQSVDEVHWGALGSLGLETEHNKLALIYMQTHVAEDKTTLLEDTRGRKMFGYVVDSYGNQVQTAAPYNRSQALDYTERDTQTLQFTGHHTIPLPELLENSVLNPLDPEIDWFTATSSAGQDTPDKRLFASYWTPLNIVTKPRRSGGFVTSTNAPTYRPLLPADNAYVGNFQRIWKNIEEDSSQYSIDAKLPFKQWSDSKGFLKLGVFNNEVDRTYHLASYSNAGDPQTLPNLDWSQLWTDYWTVNPSYPMQRNEETDADYKGHQNISAWYYMADVPLWSFVDVVGGARFESTDLKVDSLPAFRDSARYFDLHTLQWTYLVGSRAEHVHYAQDDVLPSLGLELRPLDSVKLRAAYSKTVARQTFKELAPVQQSEYYGADVFVGNPDLKMSSLKNYDLRADYTPYPGGLVSVSWFYKSITDPIEYVQAKSEYTFTYPVNYPSGTMQGYEAEVRQQLGKWWHPLDGLSAGCNVTLIDSEVELPQDEIDILAKLPYVDKPFRSRRMMGAPDYVFNANLTYDIDHFGTKLGLFYNYVGETLVTGESVDTLKNILSPAIYDMPYGTLNFSLSQKLGTRWKLSFKAKNITDPTIRSEYRSTYAPETPTHTSYTKGVDYSLEVSANW